MRLEKTSSNLVSKVDFDHFGTFLNFCIYTKFSKIVDQNSFVLNQEISEFENLFSEFTNSNFSVGCSSGTDSRISKPIRMSVKTLKTKSMTTDSITVKARQIARSPPEL